MRFPEDLTQRLMCSGHRKTASGIMKVPVFQKETIMARNQNGSTQSTWKLLSTSLAANAKDLPHLEGHQVELAGTLAKAEDLTAQFAALTASKQDISKQLTVLMEEGRKLATFLRVGVKQSYGNRSEKLVEFGLRPLRTRRKLAATPTPTTTPTPAPEVPRSTVPSTSELSVQKPLTSTDSPTPTGH